MTDKIAPEEANRLDMFPFRSVTNDLATFSRKVWMSCVIFNPRRACVARVTVLGLCVCVSVCLSALILALCTEQGGQKAIPTSSIPHWLDF